MRLDELLQERTRLLAEQRELLDAAEQRGEDLSRREDARYRENERTIEGIDEKLRAAGRMGGTPFDGAMLTHGAGAPGGGLVAAAICARPRG